jgi:hypothetical protein
MPSEYKAAADALEETVGDNVHPLVKHAISETAR